MIHLNGPAVLTVLLLLSGATVLASPGTLDAPAAVVRRAAVRALAERGEEALPELADALQSEAWLVRATACIALGEIGFAAQATLRPAFNDPDEFVRRQAARAAGSMADSEIIFDLLVAALKDPSPLVREGAAEALGSFGRAAVEPLTRTLADEENRVRAIAAHSLGTIGPEAVSAAPTILDLYETKGGWLVVVAANDALRAFGEAAVPALAKSLHREDSWQCIHAAKLLGELGAAGLPPLIRRIEESPLGPAQETLVKLGPAAKPAIPTLLRWLLDDRRWFRSRIAGAISAIDPSVPEILPVFIDILAKGPRHEAGFAAWRIARIGPSAGEAIPLLKALLFDLKPDSTERMGAIAALKAIDGKARTVLLHGLEGQNWGIRHDCVDALAAMDPPEPVALLHPDLRRDRHIPAIDALADLAKADPEVLQFLAAALDHEDESVRYRAALALGKSGSAGLTVLAAAFRPDGTGMVEGLLAGGAKGTLLLLKLVTGDLDEIWLPDRWDLSGPSESVVAAAERLFFRVKEESHRWPPAERVFVPHRPRPDSFGSATRTVAAAGKNAWPAVSGALKSGDPKLVRTALAVVDLAGEAGRALEADVLGILDQLEPDAARGAARILARMGADPAKVLPVLADGFRDTDPAPFRGPRYGVSRERERNAEAMALYGTKAAYFLLSRLDTEDPWLLSGYALVLVRVGEKESGARAIAKALGAAPRELLWEVLHTAATIGPPAVELVPALRLLAEDEDHHTAGEAVRALSTIAPAAPETLQAVLALLMRGDSGAFVRAHEMLQFLGPHAAGAVPRLREELRSGNRSRTGHAAASLARIGPAAAAALPDVRSRLDLLGPTTVPFAVGIGEKGVPLLAELLESEMPGVQWQATEALAKLGPAAALAVPRLIEHLSGSRRREAVEILLAVGPLAREARAPLKALLDGEYRGDDERVLAALRSICGDL